MRQIDERRRRAPGDGEPIVVEIQGEEPVEIAQRFEAFRSSVARASPSPARRAFNQRSLPS